jgi:hypothetical protein
MCGENPQTHSVDLEPTGPNMPNTNAKADADGQIQQLREMLTVRHTHKVPQRTGKADELQTSKDPRLVYGTHEEVPRIVSQDPSTHSNVDPQ